jgi:hypothetical protein
VPYPAADWRESDAATARPERHARWQAERRGISEEIVLAVATAPGQRLRVGPGREVRQSQVHFPRDAKVYLVRTVVDLGGDEDVVVTVYRTSSIGRYWRLG